MNYCKLCGKPLVRTNEFDTCFECEEKNRVKTITIVGGADIGKKTVVKAIKNTQKSELDKALEIFKNAYDWGGQRILKENEIPIIEQALTNANKLIELLKTFVVEGLEYVKKQQKQYTKNSEDWHYLQAQIVIYELVSDKIQRLESEDKKDD